MESGIYRALSAPRPVKAKPRATDIRSPASSETRKTTSLTPYNTRAMAASPERRTPFGRPVCSLIRTYLTIIATCSTLPAASMAHRSTARSNRKNLIGPPVCDGTSATRSSCAHSRSRSEEHTSELQSRQYLVCRLLLEKKKKKLNLTYTHIFSNCNLSS